jgi:hypothetical protein
MFCTVYVLTTNPTRSVVNSEREIGLILGLCSVETSFILSRRVTSENNEYHSGENPMLILKVQHTTLFFMCGVL